MDQRLNFQRHPTVSDVENDLPVAEASILCCAEFWRGSRGGSLLSEFRGCVCLGLPGAQHCLVGLRYAHIFFALQPVSLFVSGFGAPNAVHISVGKYEAAGSLSIMPQSRFHKDEAGGGVSLVTESATAPGMQE